MSSFHLLIMAITQKRSKRKRTGGRYRKYRKKRIYEIGNAPTNTKVGERKTRVKKTKGGKKKTTSLYADKINLIVKGKPVKAKIIKAKENTANSNYVRRNILTKGAVVETDKGPAKITNRPGQEGAVSGVLIK